jgi:polyferredoxin
MDKVSRPRGLIRFASLNNIERGEKQHFTKRMALYTVLLSGLISLFLFLVFTRAAVETTLLRAPGALFQKTAEGNIQNLYTLKIINKTTHDLPLELKLIEPAGVLRVMGAGNVNVPATQLMQTSVLIEIDPALLKGSSTKVKVGVFSGTRRVETISTAFVGPRDDARSK